MVTVAPSQALPSAATGLVGRDEEILRLVQGFRDGQTRLVTLIGPGGIGKTRLALEVGRQLQSTLADGVCFVDLSTSADARLAVEAIAEAHGIRESVSTTVLETLQRLLADAERLLILDNLEHILDVAGDIAGLLAACPGLTVLATSREPLHLAWEHEVPVSPLALPTDATLESITRSPAVALFVERARAVSPSFLLTGANAQTVGEVCERLDGVPLALELAAARTKVLPPAELVQRLNGLEVLSRPRPDAPARHHTLRAAIAWSYDLLTPAEQVLFRRLSVFVGGCTLEAAEFVGRGRDCIDTLSSLVDKSLLGPPALEDEQPRFRLLGTIRAYGLEQLTASNELNSAAADHAAYYRELAERAEPELIGPLQSNWNRLLDAELDNIRAAVGWLIEAGELTQALDLMWSIQTFLWAQGHVADIRRFIEAVGNPDAQLDLPARDHARYVHARGFVCKQLGDFGGAIPLFERAADEARRLGDDYLLGLVLLNLGFCMPAVDDLERGTSLLEASEAAFVRAEYDWGADMARMGRGEFAQLAGDLETADQQYTRVLESARRRADTRSVAQALLCMGSLALAQDDPERAVEHFAASIQHAREATTPEIVAYCIGGLAGAASARGEWGRAARLLGAADRLWQPLGIAVWANRRAAHEMLLSSVRSRLGSDFETAWTDGLRMNVEEAIADGTTRSAAATTAPTARAAGRIGRLTPRERDVAVLIARGLSSPRIAASLVISERTADAHADNIRAKLGLHSRAEIAAWAVENGLVHD
jgi:non-specific serine/threonine protein kinase